MKTPVGQAGAAMDAGLFGPDLIMRHALPLPRYTSYPTANHFRDTVTADDYRAWLSALRAGSALSLYLHIPFCESLCWYCACSTKATRRYDPVARYLTALETEISVVSGEVPYDHVLTHLHWGGGSPDILSAADILRLGDMLANRFNLRAEAEFAVEIDPRLMSAEKADSLVEIGVNRISLGVQDFDPRVQEAIGRIQSFEVTKSAVELFRARGVGSINVDLVYGLPHQTEESLRDTIEQTLQLAPDRIAIFGYAHLPKSRPNQGLIDESVLPGPVARFFHARQLAAVLEQAGYVQLGLDHFARADDGLASARLKRNFQGYTTDTADVLIGLGASAIGRLPQGYVQNAVAIADYAARVDQQGLATARGWVLNDDDRIRAFVIERLMCDFEISFESVAGRFGDEAGLWLRRVGAIAAQDGDDFVEMTGEGLRLTLRGRPFVRTVCARFDAYLAQAPDARHSLSV